MVFFDHLEGKRVGCFLGGPTRWRPVLPFPARPAVPLCAAPSRPARGMSGFWIGQINGFMGTGVCPGAVPHTLCDIMRWFLKIWIG